MTIEQIEATKVKNKTYIPTGAYAVTSFASVKNGCNVPLENNVPGFDAIEIHQDNFPSDTDGCLLLGINQAADYVGASNGIVNLFHDLFFAALQNGENISITYQ